MYFWYIFLLLHKMALLTLFLAGFNLSCHPSTKPITLYFLYVFFILHCVTEQYIVHTVYSIALHCKAENCATFYFVEFNLSCQPPAFVHTLCTVFLANLIFYISYFIFCIVYTALNSISPVNHTYSYYLSLYFLANFICYALYFTALGSISLVNHLHLLILCNSLIYTLVYFALYCVHCILCFSLVLGPIPHHQPHFGPSRWLLFVFVYMAIVRYIANFILLAKTANR